MFISIDQITSTIKNYLNEEDFFQIIDESDQHKGHAGHNPQIGLSHIAIHIVSSSFEGLTRVERQRLVNVWLDNFFKSGLHSARYNLQTPEEST